MPYAAIAGDLAAVIDTFAETLCSAGTALAERSAATRAAARFQVTVTEGADAVAAAAGDWRTLEAAGGAATAFQSLALAHRAAAVHARRGEIPRVVVIRDRGRAAVVLPTVISRIGGVRVVRFLGDPLIQYGDILAAPDADMTAIELALRTAEDRSRATVMMLRRVRADARIAPLLARRGTVVMEQAAPFVDISAGPAAHARDQRELRRLRRRLADAGDCRFAVLQGGAARAAVAEALRLKRGWLVGRGMPSSVIGHSDWEDAILAVADDASLLRAAILTVAGRLAAVEVGLVHAGRWHAFIGAHAPEFSRLGPGHVQMAETIATCRAQGFAVYDLLAPGDAYKIKIAHGAVAVRDHVVALTGAGRLGLIAAPLLPAVKQLASRMPPGLRRILLGTAAPQG